MIHLSRALVRRWRDALLHIDDTPKRTAAAFALGVFFGFSPVLGLHTVLALAVAFALNLNRVATLLGVYANLPWIIAPYYTLSTMAGAALLRTRLPPDFGVELTSLFALSIFTREFWAHVTRLMSPLLWPYLVGSSAVAVLLALSAYPLALAFIVSHRRLKHAMHKEG